MSPQLQLMLQQAIQAFQGKNFDGADLILKRILQIESKNLPALHILGLIKVSQSSFREAADYLARAARINPNDASIQYNLAKVLSDMGNDKDALFHHKKTVALAPNNIEAWLNYGKTSSNLGCHEDALTCYGNALLLRPDYAEVLLNKSATLATLKRYEEAITFAELALAVNPNLAEAWSNKGIALRELKRFDEAISCFDKALDLKPDCLEALTSKGVVLHELKYFDEAIACYDKVLDYKPNYHETLTSKGAILYELKRFDEAIACYDEALGFKPDYHEALKNKGVILHELKRFNEAIACYDNALSHKSDCHEVTWNKSLSLLLLGDFENGLPLYESRWSSVELSEIAGRRFFDKPIWLGAEPLQGKTILLYGEQGLGDFIQFCRYIKLVADLGAKVVLETPPSLASLMVNLEGVSQIVIKGKDLPFFDYQCPLLSLPLAFNSNILSIPVESSYLTSDLYKTSRWQLKLGEKRKKRVGLVWSSVSGFREDYKRSLLLADFVKALPAEGFEYICLQKELKECDKEFFASYQNIKFFGDELIDFSDTASLIDCVDLVVSTCTSIPHLSAALGKETWVLLSHLPDWRWLLDRESSPWYPSVKLYRQPAYDDWDGVLKKVKLDLMRSLDF